MTKNPALFYGAIVVAILSIALSVYYIMPGYPHILVTHDPTLGHPTHAFAFGGLAVICIIAALVTRPKSSTR
ncbi:MAG: hypothetical protein JOZ18_00345 [Chloroflexi bacterium]|nr:hypothetical protein [Chloroflexota bacterium]